MDIRYADSSGWLPENLLPLGRPVGRYVLAEEAEKLEQLNKEMLKMLKRLKSHVVLENTNVVHTEIYTQLQSIIAKAEGA
jgi:hypothetical protein